MPDLNNAPAAIDAPPLVFVGPSAPVEDVHRFLPAAIVCPPVRRGDLHAARLMRYSVFVVIDGVFGQDQAISPREVIDVLHDGAHVIGASSMGALRAVDCAPGGAVGVGAIHRLFRSGAIGSEDEVAVSFHPGRPYPSLSEPLAGMRLSLRAARRRGLISDAEELRLLIAAHRLPFDQRTWLRTFENARLRDRLDELGDFLTARNVKRTDAALALQWVARRSAEDPEWSRRPRLSRSTFGVLDPPRRARDPADALEKDADCMAPGLLLWLLLSGRANRYFPDGTAALDKLNAVAPPSDWATRLENLAWDEVGPEPVLLRRVWDDLGKAIDAAGMREAEVFRFLAISRALRSSENHRGKSNQLNQRMVEAQLSIAHGMPNWTELRGASSAQLVVIFEHLKLLWSGAKGIRQKKYILGGAHG